MLREMDMEVFENSGNNLAEYFLKKKGKKMPGRLFRLIQDEHDGEVSFKLIKEHQRKSHPKDIPDSSSSSSGVSFRRFMPSTASTPYPPAARSTQSRKIISMRKSLRPEPIVYPGKRSVRHDRPSSRLSIIHCPQSDPVSSDTNHREITLNNRSATPSPACPPFADVPPESRTSMIQMSKTDRENGKISSNLSSKLRVRNISEMQNKTIKSHIPAESIHGKSKQSKKTLSITEKSANEERELCTSDDDDVIVIDPETPSSEVVQTNTIKEVQRMDISEPEKRSSTNSTEISPKGRQKTNTSAITMDHNYFINSCSSDEDDDTLVPQNLEQQPQKDVTSMCDVRVPQQKDDATSGFVDFSTQSTRTTTSKPREQVLPMVTLHKSVIPEMPENNNTLPSLVNKQSELPPPSAPASSNNSGTFKAPLASGQRIKRKRKIDSPLARMIELENTIRKSVPRKIGTSRRKLYSKDSNADSGESLVQNIPNDSALNKSQQQQQESAVEVEVEQEIEEDEDEILHISNLIQPCSVAMNRVDLQEKPIGKKQQKHKKVRKQKVTPEPMQEEVEEEEEEEEQEQEEEEQEEEETATLRRSKRTRCAPVPFWLGAQYTPLTVKTYNEKVDLKKRYVKQGLNSMPALKGDFTILMDKKKKKKARPKQEKYYKIKKPKDQKNNKQTEVVEPQLDAVQVDCSQSPKAVNKKSRKNTNRRKERNQKPDEIEVHEENLQVSTERDEMNEQNTNGKGDSLTPDNMSSYSGELLSLTETEQLLAAQVIDNESHSCQHLEKKTDIDGIHMFVANGSDRCGYFLFEPGIKKRSCRVTHEYLHLIVLKGTFLTRIDGYYREVEKNNIIILQKGTKYELTYLMHNQDQGKLLFIFSEY